MQYGSQGKQCYEQGIEQSRLSFAKKVDHFSSLTFEHRAVPLKTVIQGQFCTDQILNDSIIHKGKLSHQKFRPLKLKFKRTTRGSGQLRFFCKCACVNVIYFVSVVPAPTA